MCVQSLITRNMEYKLVGGHYKRGRRSARCSLQPKEHE